MTDELQALDGQRVRRRPAREDVVVVVAGDRVLVQGVDPGELEVFALAYGLEHRWMGSGWSFATEDALRVGAALRAAGWSVWLSSGPVTS